jgi:hypothetical protein
MCVYVRVSACVLQDGLCPVGDLYICVRFVCVRVCVCLRVFVCLPGVCVCVCERVFCVCVGVCGNGEGGDKGKGKGVVGSGSGCGCGWVLMHTQVVYNVHCTFVGVVRNADINARICTIYGRPRKSQRLAKMHNVH